LCNDNGEKLPKTVHMFLTSRVQAGGPGTCLDFNSLEVVHCLSFEISNWDR